MRPAFGLAGPGFRTESIASDGWLLFSLIKLAPGLEYTNPVKICLAMGSDRAKIKGMNWLTILSDKFVADLGGLKAMRAALEPDCIVHIYDGGVLIQAGDTPQLCDGIMSRLPETYRKLGSFIDPIIFDAYGKPGLFPVPKPLDPPQEAAKWAHRFNQ
jgi:hypothetical protein